MSPIKAQHPNGTQSSFTTQSKRRKEIFLVDNTWDSQRGEGTLDLIPSLHTCSPSTTPLTCNPPTCPLPCLPLIPCASSYPPLALSHRIEVGAVHQQGAGAGDEVRKSLPEAPISWIARQSAGSSLDASIPSSTIVGCLFALIKKITVL